MSRLTEVEKQAIRLDVANPSAEYIHIRMVAGCQRDWLSNERLRHLARVAWRYRWFCQHVKWRQARERRAAQSALAAEQAYRPEYV